MMTNIYLIRHAEAEGNLYRRAQGHYDSLLTPRGRRQAEAVGERLAGVPLAAVYTSDLRRTAATAEVIAARHGLPALRDRRLREVCLGVWEDRPWGNIEYEEPEQLAYFTHTPMRWRVEGAEPYPETRTRILGALADLAARHEGQSIALVSHGMVLRCLFSALLGVPEGDPERVPHADNTAVSLVRGGNGVFTVEYYGDNSHLTEGLSTLARQDWWKDGSGRDTSNLRFASLDLHRQSELYADCYADAWRCAHGTEQGFDRRLYIQAAQKRHRDKASLMAAYRGDDFAGLVALDERRGAKQGIGWISLCYILPELRGRRYGTQLVGEAVSYFRKHGRRVLRLTVAEENGQAAGFYRRLGFSEIGRESGALGTLLVMEKGL